MKAQTKAEEPYGDSSASGVVFWFFLECIAGRILGGWDNKYNKYCSKQYLLLLEITKCPCCSFTNHILSCIIVRSSKKGHK